jgi:preprotein translocase subunit SecA
VVNGLIDQYMPPQSLEEQWDVPGLEILLKAEFGVEFPLQQWLEQESGLDEQDLRDRILSRLEQEHEEKAQAVGEDVMHHLEQAVMLQVLDKQWKDHLAAMDFLRQGIHLRGYAQKNPKQEYKKEAFELFSDMLDRIKSEVIFTLAKVQVQSDEDVAALEQQRHMPAQMEFVHPDLQQPMEDLSEAEEGEAAHKPIRRDTPKVGRNEPCPCGSGKKYKHCHGKLQ